jgi:hypothetical protein
MGSQKTQLRAHFHEFIGFCGALNGARGTRTALWCRYFGIQPKQLNYFE